MRSNNSLSMTKIILSFCLFFGVNTRVEAQSASSVASESSAPGLKQDFAFNSGDNNQPMFIKSDTVSLDAKKHIFFYRGNVEVTKGEMIVTSDRITGNYDENNKLNDIFFEENVVLTKGETIRATANRAVYHIKSDTVVMTEAPEVIDRGNALTADKITVYLKEDRSEAEGNVRVKLIKTNNKDGVDPIAGKKGAKSK
ncbi:MAG: lipopolysaccharide transport periplasmic protein LptA [Deltaproteobacteria bacterium]|nr:lipopolysaccharide transport periplasmic protein LptA [Deltaproteobacteria bacterium]